MYAWCLNLALQLNKTACKALGQKVPDTAELIIPAVTCNTCTEDVFLSYLTKELFNLKTYAESPLNATDSWAYRYFCKNRMFFQNDTVTTECSSGLDTTEFWEGLSSHRMVNLGLVDNYAELPWCVSAICKNPNIRPWDIVRRYENTPELSANVGLTWCFVLVHEKLNWDFEVLSRNPMNVGIADLTENLLSQLESHFLVLVIYKKTGVFLDIPSATPFPFNWEVFLQKLKLTKQYSAASMS